MDCARRLGDILVDEAGVAPAVVDHALGVQKQSRKRLGAILVELGAVKPERLARALASQFAMRYVDPLAERVDPLVLWRLPRDIAERHCAIPLVAANGVLLAMSEPRNAAAVRELTGLLGIVTAELSVAAEDRVLEAIRRHYNTSPAQARQVGRLTGEERAPVTSPTGLGLDAKALLARLRRGPGKPVVDAVTALLSHAVEAGARELRMDEGLVQHVVDGIAVDILEIPAALAAPVAMRLRVVAGLDPGEIRKRTEARTRLVLGDRSLDLASSAAPGKSGGSVHLRFVPPARRPSDLGMAPPVLAAWQAVASGLVVMAGEGLATTAGGAVVELRDRGAAEAAIADARTRLVHARVSADSAAEALAHLRDLGTPMSALASVLQGVLVQKLIRRVCPWCALAAVPADAFGTTVSAPLAGTGCPTCRYRAYDGTFAAFEFVQADDALRGALADGAGLHKLAEIARPVAGRTLRDDALARAIAGETTVAEVVRTVPAPPAWVEPAPVSAPAGAPRVVVLHPDILARPELRAALDGVEIRFVWSPETVRTAANERPTLAIVSMATDGWAESGAVGALIAAGTRVVMIGKHGGIEEMRAAFACGANDYAATTAEAGLRAARLLAAG